MTYKVIAEMALKNNMVITVDKCIAEKDFDYQNVMIDDTIYNYTLTHSNYIIVVKTTDSLLNKTVQFVE